MSGLSRFETAGTDACRARSTRTRGDPPVSTARVAAAAGATMRARHQKRDARGPSRERSSRHTSRHRARRHRKRESDDDRRSFTTASASHASAYAGSTSTAQRLLEEEHAQRTLPRRIDSFGNVAYENYFLSTEILREGEPGAAVDATGKRLTVPPMLDVPWELRKEATSAPQLCAMLSFLGTRHFWWLIEYAARVTFIAMLLPCAIIYAELPHTPFISMSFALTSVVIAVGTTVGMSMLFFLQYFKAGCIWLPITTICVALHLDEYLAAWFVVYVVLLFLMAMFTEKTTRRMCLLLFNIPMVALLGGSHDLVYPTRVLADWFLGAAFALLATLLPYPMLATRASHDISAELFRNTATCFTGILDCFWAPSNTERSMSMVRIRYLVRTIDQLIDKFDVYDAFTFYEVLFFESYEYRQVRKEKVRLLFQLKMNLRTMERVINMVQERPQMLDQTERCLLLRSHVSRPMDAISRSVETLLYHISKAKTYAALRELTHYYELVGRSIKYLQNEFDIARRVLFYESGHYSHHHHPHTRSDRVNEGEFDNSGHAVGSASALKRAHRSGQRNASHGDRNGQSRHASFAEQGVVDGIHPPCLISMDASTERMEEYVPLMTFFVFSIVNFWGTLRDYEQQMDRVHNKPGLRDTIYFVWRGVIDPFIDNARLVQNLFTNPTEPDVRIVIEAAKVSVAMLISVLFFYYIDDHSLLLSGPTIIAFVSGTNPVEAVQASAARLTGTLMGSVLGFFAATLCTTNVDRVASICVITFVMSFFRPEQKFGTICMYCNFVAISAMTDKTARSNLSRIQQNTFAIFIYCFISVAFFPVSPNKVLFEKRLAVVRGVADTVKRLMGLLHEASVSYEETQLRARSGTENVDGAADTDELNQGMTANGKRFSPRAVATTAVTHTTDSGLNMHSSSHERREPAPLLFEPISVSAGAMFPPPTMTNASRLAATTTAARPALGQDDKGEEEMGVTKQCSRGPIGGGADGGDQGATTALPVNDDHLDGSALMRSRIAVENPQGTEARREPGAPAVLPNAFTMAPEDPTIDSIFTSIFGMLDTMKTTTSIMPLAADEFNVVPKEYPLRASGEVHAALYRICALVYTMASCWKVMRDKGYFTADMVHIFHNLAPLAIDIASCLDRFAHILTYYVHAPSAALSSELTKGVMQLRVLCTELSVRKERDLLAVIRQTIAEQQVWRPRRGRRSPSRASSSSSTSSLQSSSESESEFESSSSSSLGLVPRAAPAALAVPKGGASGQNDRDVVRDVSRLPAVFDAIEPQVTNDTLVFNRSLFNAGLHEGPLNDFLRQTEHGSAWTSTELPRPPGTAGDEEDARLVRSVSTASASMTALSFPTPKPELSAASPKTADGKPNKAHAHAHHHKKEASRGVRHSDDGGSGTECQTHDTSKASIDHKKRARTTSPHGMSHSTSAASLHAGSTRVLGQSWSSSAVDFAASDDPHREGAERLRQKVRRARQLARHDTLASSLSHHHDHHDRHSHHGHHHRRARSEGSGNARTFSAHTPFEESLISAPYGSVEGDVDTLPAVVSPSTNDARSRAEKAAGVTAAEDVDVDVEKSQTASLSRMPYRSSVYTSPVSSSSHKDREEKKKKNTHDASSRSMTRQPDDARGKEVRRRRPRRHHSRSSSSSTASASSDFSTCSRSSGNGSLSRRNSSVSLVQFNDSFTTPITVYDAEGLHGYTLALEMLAKEMRRMLFGLEEMLQNQV